MITRTIECDVCGQTENEAAPNAGWQGWGALHGVMLNASPNPNLCPLCLARVAEFTNALAGGGQ